MNWSIAWVTVINFRACIYNYGTDITVRTTQLIEIYKFLDSLETIKNIYLHGPKREHL